ncbi:MAG TPA: hypothetical protein VMW38_21840 [Terriglobia bacterium]|nr:hypothetical protein [Terriglobia bacterium]
MSELPHSEDRETPLAHPQPRNPDVAYEHRDLDFRTIVKFAVALVIFTCVGFIYLWGLFSYFQKKSANQELKPPLLASERRRLPPEPRLQGAPGNEISGAMELQKFRRQEDRQLRSYGWVDRKAGVVRIPIEEAKARLLKRGLPTRQENLAAGSASLAPSSIDMERKQQQSRKEGVEADSPGKGGSPGRQW